MKHLEENIIVDCDIKTFSTDDFHNVSLADECNLNKMVVNANIFQELLYRLDNSADEVHIKLSPDPPYFSLTATGRSVRRYQDQIFEPVLYKIDFRENQ